MEGAALNVVVCVKCGALVSGKCKSCRNAYMREWNAANPDKVKASAAKKHAKNREADNAKNRAWRAANREKVALSWKAFHERNLGREVEWNRKKRVKNREKNRQTQQAYFAAHPGLKNLWDANRRASEKRATPSWANEFFIGEAYRLAKLREKVCGGKWHVDHRVPLQSKLVCGLHVEHNLQVIPQSVNQRKSNRHWPDMP